MSWTPDSISHFLRENQHRLDNPSQWLGNEPNVPVKDWDCVRLRVLLAASWPYEHAAGNQSIPAVWKAVNDHDRYLCDRYYLPSTPRDMRIFERGGVPVFGLEHRYPLGDYDIVGTSISYVVLLINFVHYLAASGVPIRWRDRVPEEHPMVMVGGQAYCNPEVMAPVVDCVFLGEAEDEAGNGGIGQVLRMIEMFKQEGSWNVNRVDCYRRLACTFNYLYFPRFVDVLYDDRDGSKQVCGYRTDVPGMRMPFRKRHVIDLDKIKPLDSPPLLYTNPSLGAGDVETSRGCPAWCAFCRLSYSQKPFRQKSVEKSVAAARGFRNSIGGVEISPFGPDFPMQSVDIDATLVTTSYGIITLREMLGDKRGVQLPLGNSVRVRGHDEPLEAVYHTRTSNVGIVRASNGAEVRVTSEHLVRVVTPGDRKWQTVRGRRTRKREESIHSWLDRSPEAWREASELREGDWLRCYYGRTDWPAERARLEDESDLTPGMAWLLGFLSGDADVSPPYRCRFRVSDMGLRARVNAEIRSMGYEPWNGYEHGRQVVQAGKWFVDWLRQFGIMDNASKRHVPLQIRCSPRDVLAAYMTGCMDADGCVPVRSGSGRNLLEVVHTTASEEFSRELMSIALALGHPVSLVRSGAAWNLTLHTAYDADWSWLRFSEVHRALALDTALALGLDRGHKMFPQSGIGGVYYAKVTVPWGQQYVADVGDIEVPSARCFNVNGMVVHNTNKNALLKALLEQVTDKVDTVAQRIDDFIGDETYLMLQSAGGARSITLGLEGVSQRMRDLVGKATSDAEVLEAVTRGIRAGFRKFKLFMIVGLPGEDTGDMARIMQLGRDIAAVRDSLAADKVTVQFSFTPLLYEAQTPFQWFSCWPVPDHDLIDVFDELKQLKILAKIGSKAEFNKVHFFQLCQRASRDAGEAVIDVLEDLDTGCWGGVPRDMAVRLEAALRAHGFAHGFADLFGERGQDDMLGWEFISTGISRNLLWQTFERMREFAKQTDSKTYDTRFDERYHGNEWIDRCLAEGTKLRLADGSVACVEDLAGTECDVLAGSLAGEAVNAHAHAVWEVGERDDVVEVTFEDGSTVRLTADHKVMLADGSFVEAGVLGPEYDVATVQGPVSWKPRLPGWEDLDAEFWENVVLGSVPERWGSATGVVFDGSPCRLWDGPLDENGYGYWLVRSVGRLSAFAYAWTSVNGPVPADKVLNHMCHVKQCIWHIEACTVGENTRQAFWSSTKCRNGMHLRTPENLIEIGSTGRFRCEPCYRETLERYYEARARRAGRIRLPNGSPSCRHGHEYTKENTGWRLRKSNGRMYKVCKQCARDHEDLRTLRRQSGELVWDGHRYVEVVTR